MDEILEFIYFFLSKNKYKIRQINWKIGDRNVKTFGGVFFFFAHRVKENVVGLRGSETGTERDIMYGLCIKEDI